MGVQTTCPFSENQINKTPGKTSAGIHDSFPPAKSYELVRDLKNEYCMIQLEKI